MFEITIKTNKKSEFVDITAHLEKLIKENYWKNGVLYLNVLHTTAGLTINENVDPNVKLDLINALDMLVPNINFMHAEGNSDAHLKSSLIGTCLTIPLIHGQLLRGIWQGIYFCEFDGPRERVVNVTYIGS